MFGNNDFKTLFNDVQLFSLNRKGAGYVKLSLDSLKLQKGWNSWFVKQFLS